MTNLKYYKQLTVIQNFNQNTYILKSTSTSLYVLF